MKLRNKLMLGFLTIALLNFIVGNYCINRSQAIMEKIIGTNSVALAQETLDAIDRDIYYKIERWRSYAAVSPQLREVALLSNQEFEALDNMQEYINEREKRWSSKSKKTTPAFIKELIDNKLSESLRKRSDFYNKKYGHKTIGEIFITNKYGTNIAETGKTTDYYQADEKWWQEARDNGLYVENVKYDESADIYSSAICIRIDDENGTFLGIMKVLINIEDLIDMVKGLQGKLITSGDGGTSGNIHVIDTSGKIVFVVEEKGEHGIFEDMGDRVFMENIKQNKGYFVSKGHHFDKREYLYAYVHSKGYRDYKGLGWLLVIGQQTKALFVPIVNIKKLLLIASLVISVIALIIGFFVAYAISVPISKLTDATDKMGKGERGARVKIGSKDEIGQLAGSFNQMAEVIERLDRGREEEINITTDELRSTQERTTKLEKGKDGLEQAVVKRTKELEERVVELERYENATMDRELRMEELRKKIEELENKLKKKA